MPQYTVRLLNTVSTVVTVDAVDPDTAIEAAYASEDMPSSMSHGAFGAAPVDECGEWLPSVVTDAAGVEVWSDRGADTARRR